MGRFEQIRGGGRVKILVVEDEQDIAAAIVRVLSDEGHAVTWAPDGDHGYNTARFEGFDVVLLDVMLPKRDGWQLLTDLRAAHVTVPVLMLTARDEVKDKVKGLNLGADDYLPKPFDTEELVARVHALGRRDKVHKASRVAIADLEIDRNNREVTRAGKRIVLTRREYDLLEALALNQGRVLSRETIQERVWGDELRHTNTVDVFVANLRKKVDAPFESRLIHTAVGFGYVLRVDA